MKFPSKKILGLLPLLVAEPAVSQEPPKFYQFQEFSRCVADQAEMVITDEGGYFVQKKIGEVIYKVSIAGIFLGKQNIPERDSVIEVFRFPATLEGHLMTYEEADGAYYFFDGKTEQVEGVETGRQIVDEAHQKLCPLIG